MPGHADKAMVKSVPARAPAVAQDGAATTAMALADDRPVAIAQLQLRQTLDAAPRVRQLQAIGDALGQSRHVSELAARRATRPTAPSGIAIDKPVQRVVKLNVFDYGAAKAGLLRRKLAATELTAAEIDIIVAQASEAGPPYVYNGTKRPMLQPRAVAPLAPVPLPGPVAPLGALGGGALVLPDPVAVAPPQPAPQIAPGPDADDVVEPALAHPGVQNALPVPDVANVLPDPGAQPGAEHVPVPGPVPVPLAVGPAAAGGGGRVPLPRAPAGNLAALRDYLGKKTLAQYQAEYAARTAKVDAMGIPDIVAGTALFHATQRATARLIRDGGLQPKRPEWGGASSSKDNYLSFAPRESQANAMGGRGVAIVMRVILADDEVGPGKWRHASDSELITTQSFAPERLMWSSKTKPLNWQAMDTLPDQ